MNLISSLFKKLLVAITISALFLGILYIERKFQITEILDSKINKDYHITKVGNQNEASTVSAEQEMKSLVVKQANKIAIKNPKNNTDKQVIAYVNDKPIYEYQLIKKLENLFNKTSESRTIDLNKIDDRTKILVIQDIVINEILRKEALNSNIQNNAKFQELILTIIKAELPKLYLENKASVKVTDAQIKSEYDKKLGELKGTKQILTSHILVKTQKEANNIHKNIISEIKTKSKQEVCSNKAQKYSIDTSTANKGGNLGYLTKGTMIKEFENKVFSMNAGDISKPFKTNLGYHIICIFDKQDFSPLPFEKTRLNLRKLLEAKYIQQYILDITKTMDVKLVEQQRKASLDKKQNTEN